MPSIYQQDLAYIHACGFGGLARGAAPEIVRRLRAAEISVHSVVDVGCGAGPLAKSLIDAGFQVTGIDPSTELLEIGHREVPRAEFIHGSVYEIELPPCEAIVALGEPLTYHTHLEKADRLVQEFFQRSAARLPLGGLLIFDVIALGEPSLAGRSWMSGDDWAVLAETTEDPHERSLIRRIETFRRAGDLYRRSHEVHTVRLFDVAELCRKLAACGFFAETAQSYGEQILPPRRHAIFATLQRRLNPGG